jgi:PEP-CTERM motif-containing protein
MIQNLRRVRMGIQDILRTMVCVAGLAAASIQSASASQVLYDGIGFLTGQQSFTDSFAVSGPGTLTVTLSDFAWPVALSSLDLVMSSSQGLLGPEMGAGTANFNVAAGGNVFAQWFGTAQGPLDAGVYGLKVQWTPIAPVPLPTSIALLLSGLGLLAWQRRARDGMGSCTPKAS